jgi:gamma-glutamylaminecyclotransferase
MSESEPTLVFVYGTLMRGGCRSVALSGQRCLGTARTMPRYRMYDCGSYPGLIEVERGRAIMGEVWEVDAACLARLDDVEGVSEDWFARREIVLQSPFDEAPAQAYFYLHPVRHLRECGPRWINR